MGADLDGIGACVCEGECGAGEGVRREAGDGCGAEGRGKEMDEREGSGKKGTRDGTHQTC